jgi:hypothetical protein
VKKSEHLKKLLEQARVQLDVLYYQRKVLNKHIEQLEDIMLELSVDITSFELEEEGLLVNSSTKKDDGSLTVSVHKKPYSYNFYEV